MTLTTRIASAALFIAASTGLMPVTAAPAEAQTSVSISYRDYDRGSYRDGYRDVRRDRHYRDRHYRGHREARRDWGRHDRRYRNWYGYNQYRAPRRCWTETRWDRWRGERYRVRICR